MTHNPLFDPGLQPEHTDLAWRRTILALTGGALLSLRLLPPVLGSWSLGIGLLGLLLAGACWIVGRRRAGLVRIALLAEPGPLSGAVPLLFLALVAGAAATLDLGLRSSQLKIRASSPQPSCHALTPGSAGTSGPSTQP